MFPLQKGSTQPNEQILVPAQIITASLYCNIEHGNLKSRWILSIRLLRPFLVIFTVTSQALDPSYQPLGEIKTINSRAFTEKAQMAKSHPPSFYAQFNSKNLIYIPSDDQLPTFDTFSSLKSVRSQMSLKDKAKAWFRLSFTRDM